MFVGLRLSAPMFSADAQPQRIIADSGQKGELQRTVLVNVKVYNFSWVVYLT